ncbi:DUF2283 domain-containing protein [Pseudochrobactrum sp. Wa41.01b-1]|uniref:DUF2283 domain-containing protein n=1 Tax=Pseudochrobactrum sp. Wa41.01b-1 TaxID=2864102 RepID=UPI001C68E57D|nr:DUF2283 domain-containing protein [Pseudochrobactrum sp. Wa41.01b-1]QYM73294.1 DUF2283 domain-containing protein [Pseudochrobactrum sp. Wa41.01b-1]
MSEILSGRGGVMKLTYDAAADVAYIQFKSDEDETAFGFTYCCDPHETDGEINLDFNSDGRLIGIEILQASKKLPAYLLALSQS